jgi:hypothetical protein
MEDFDDEDPGGCDYGSWRNNESEQVQRNNAGDPLLMQMDGVEDGIAYLLLFVNPICCDVTRLSFYIQNDALDYLLTSSTSCIWKLCKRKTRLYLLSLKSRKLLNISGSDVSF